MAISLRPARLADAPLLEAWDLEPHVIACSTDDPNATSAFDGIDWVEELAAPTPFSEHLIAEVDDRPIGAMQIIDPRLEPSHYWGEIEAGLRAIDIWIGPPEALNRGFGSEMMRQALERCFADPAVTAIVIDPLNSNVAAHRFYRRLGFEAVGRRMFGDDDCLVHRLTRERWALEAAGPTKSQPAR